MGSRSTKLKTSITGPWGARDRFFATTDPQARLAATLVEVSKLFADEFLIEIEAVVAAERNLPILLQKDLAPPGEQY